ncbi:adp-heptose synthase / d-glycero-beta-d-manno-heptose 7-phosphate kinase [hydrocarbon metagenome]|uniref:Adp-heptose synthase / d-glycero-beta-d-manno-heptose 7-phosphate kinase n=1 Tax=hydrocarbon metagenome TaxID=938273 RepID=A0A0W8FR22_9ZZZZ
MHRILTKKRALDIIANFSGAGVLVVGDVMVDHFIWGNVSRISPEAPVPVVDVQKDSIMLGGCANVLNNIYAMGGKAYVAGVIGADNIGKKLLAELRGRKIETKGIVVERRRPTTLKTRIVAHGQQMVRFDKENRKPIPQTSIDGILKYVKSLRNKIGAIVISDYNKGVVSKELIEGIKKITEGSNIVICVDPKQNNFSIYKGVYVITPNHHEAQRAAGMEITNADDLQRLSEALLKKYVFQTILITRGEEGMSLFENGRKIVHTYFPAQAKEVYDVTGAGDTVIGMLALGLAARADIKEATCLANLAAGIVVGKIGTATVSQKELLDVL